MGVLFEEIKGQKEIEYRNRIIFGNRNAGQNNQRNAPLTETEKMKIFSINAGNFKCDGGAMFGVVPKFMWEKHYPCDEQNFCCNAMRSLLIDTGDRLVLIDTGIGNKFCPEELVSFIPFGDATLCGSIEGLGYRLSDVTDVIFTHLHFDHCGGAVGKDSITGKLYLNFPNASHWVSRKQFENYLHPNRREADAYFPDNVTPLQEAGKLCLVENEMELTDGIALLLYDGHTPGFILPVITRGEYKIAYVGDVIPTLSNIRIKWVSAYDKEPDLSLHAKTVFLQRAVRENYLLFFQHDFYTEACTLADAGKAVRVGKTGKLDELMRQ